MRASLRCALASSMLLWLSACCSGKKCTGYEGNEQTAPVVFDGFSPAETDTIVIRRYATDTSLHALDSMTGNGEAGLLLGNFSDGFTGAFYPYTYRIYVAGPGRTYQVSHFEMSSTLCGTCWFLDKPSEYRNLAAYEVDGQRKTGEIVHLTR